ncbi:unnamed protein product, partial [Heterosigma akashiwo]
AGSAQGLRTVPRGAAAGGRAPPAGHHRGQPGAEGARQTGAVARGGGAGHGAARGRAGGGPGGVQHGHPRRRPGGRAL